MERRALGRTGLEVSALGFGCGAVGGLMVRGDPGAQRRAVERALAAGVRYFDTAPGYGDGRSEENLGRVLREIGAGAAGAVVGTKLRLDPAAASAGGRGSSGRCGSRSPRACAAWGGSGWICCSCTTASWRGQ